MITFQTLITGVKQTFLASSLGIAVSFLPAATYALTPQDVPNPREEYGGWVTDMENILSEETERKLNQMISELEAENGTEIAVVTVPETAPSATPKNFATELFNYWGIGKADVDNGVLFLISTGDRRVEIETGYGIEPILPDAQVGRILDTKILPKLKKGNFDAGTLAGTKALIAELDSDFSNNSVSTGFSWGVLGASGGILVLIAGGTIFAVRRKKTYLEPQGRSQGNKEIWRPVYCAECKQEMERVAPSTVESYLSDKEKTERSLNSVLFEGWKCPSCSESLKDQNFHLRSTVIFSNFHKCPECSGKTVKRAKKTIKAATYTCSGKRLVSNECQHCNHSFKTEETIPQLHLPSYRSSSSSSSRSSYSGYSGGGYSGGGFSGGGGCSGGGGSFGGGSSGGGGAGGSF